MREKPCKVSQSEKDRKKAFPFGKKSSLPAALLCFQGGDGLIRHGWGALAPTALVIDWLQEELKYI